MDDSQPADNASGTRGSWDDSNRPEQDTLDIPSLADSAASDREAAQAAKTSLHNPLQEKFGVGGRPRADGQQLEVPDSEDEDGDTSSDSLSTVPSSSPHQSLPLAEENETNKTASNAAPHESSGPPIPHKQEAANDRPSVTNEPTIPPSENHSAHHAVQQEKKRKFEEDSTATSIDAKPRSVETQDTTMTDLEIYASKIIERSSNPSPRPAGGADMKSMEDQADQRRSQSKSNPQSQSPSHVQAETDSQAVTVLDQVDADNSSIATKGDLPKLPNAAITLVPHSNNDGAKMPISTVASEQDAPVSQSAETEPTTSTTDTASKPAASAPPAEAEPKSPTTDTASAQDPSTSQPEPPSSTETASNQPSPIPQPTKMEPALTPEEQETLSAMQARTTTLEATHTELSSRQSTLIRSLAAVPSISATLASTTHADAVIDAAKAVIREHIRLLHDYNEIRDIGQGLMGIIAESRGVRIKEVQDEFDISAKD